ncbi:hypothetical protein ACFYYY_15185 [Streptomyces sp. NPDC001834]|uniref:hypothetical protein n=1 Tax=Streptomyces sp. NPDC001834 TaxID=3364616 RepID=UPI0036A8DD64
MTSATVTPEEFEDALAVTKSALRDALLTDPELEQRLPKASGGLERAEEEIAAGRFVGPVFQIGNAARDLALKHYLREDPERARKLLQLALRLYEFHNPTGTYDGSIDTCRRNLDALGAAPVQRSAGPGMSEARPSAPYVAAAPAPTPSAPVPVPRAAVPPLPRPLGESAPADGTELDVPPNWERLLDEWRRGGEGESPVEDLIDRLRTQITEVLTRSAPAAAERLTSVMDADLRGLAEHLADVTVPLEDAPALHQRAKEARWVSRSGTIQYAKGMTAAEPRTLRTQWLTSALWNHCLRRHLPTNDHQTVADVLGYLQVFQIENRYRNDQRELLLAVTEGAALLAVGELQVFELMRVPHVYGWLRHAVGIQLHIGGPDPVDPDGSRYHERVLLSHDPMRWIHPEYWATHLLNQWADRREYGNSVAFILLILSGWKADQLERMLDALYRGAPGAAGERDARDDRDGKERPRDFWYQQAMDMLARTRTVRVVKNAWEPGAATASSSLSMRDQDEFVQLPNRLLQGVVAELAPRSHGTVVQGALFSDRPVPTFLTFNNFGPVGVLKIDEAVKVRREKENFDEFGELLHPFYRSSKCVVGTTTVPNSSNGRRYQGILTSYVFRDGEEPTTLRDWLCKRVDQADDEPAPPAGRPAELGADDEPVGRRGDTVVRNVVEELFLKGLGPWLSNASRTIGDLRGEYPALRPASFERTSYAPGKDAESELAHFRLPEAADTFGITGGLPARPRYLEPLLKGSALGHSPLITERDRRTTNPLWLVAHVADVQAPDDETAPLLDWLLYDRQHGLATRSYLTCVSHGDLHGENVLASGPDARRPALYIIDFETTHRGHICKDFARLESALWSRTFPWNPEQLGQIRAWFGRALHGEALWEAPIPEDADPHVRRVMVCVTKLRSILKGCEQRNWPFGDLEYQWALLASLLPFARYRDHKSPGNRYLPFLLAADVAEALVTGARTSM